MKNVLLYFCTVNRESVTICSKNALYDEKTVNKKDESYNIFLINWHLISNVYHLISNV